MKRKNLLFLAILVGFLPLVRPIFGQVDKADIVGRIQDSSGAVLPGAPVEIKRLSTNQVFRAVSSTTGDYSIVNLIADTYDIEASLPGFRKVVRKGVTLEIGRTYRFDFELTIGDIAQTLEVTADAPPLRTESPELGLVIDKKKVDSLPNSFRDWTAFIALVPGATPSRSNYAGGGLAAYGFNVGGFRRSDNVFKIDGTVMSTNFALITFFPNLDAIQEVDVKTSLYGAEYGQRPGGQINAVTKSGTNDLHGTVFDFLRNSALDARNFFAPTKPPYKRNLFGATAGGPIFIPRLFDGHDKAWFFVSYAGERRRQLRILTGQVPTVDEKNGHFGTAITDPLTRQPFANNIIPSDRFNPIARKLMAFWPDPNTTGRGFNFTSPNSSTRFNENQLIAKVDWDVSASDRWSFRFVNSSSPVDNTNAISTFSTLDPFKTWGPSITNTRTFAGRLVNEFGIHLFRRPAINGSIFSVAGFGETLGWPNYPRKNIDRDGVPITSVTGYLPLGDSPNKGPVVLGYWEVKDNLSFSRRSHSLKMGYAWLRHFNLWVLEDRTRLNFIPRYTGNAFADFLLGFPSSTSQGAEFLRWNMHQDTSSFYLQDNWTVSPRLTVNLGLRYEYRGPVFDKRGFSGNFNPSTARLDPPLQNITLLPGETGRFQADTPLVSWKKTGFLPRVGLAFRLSDKTVIRSGYGVYANEPNLGMIQGIGQNPRPGSDQISYLADANTPTISLSNPFSTTAAPGSTFPNVFGVQTALPQALTHSWGLTIQRELASKMVFEVGYQGSHSVHQPHMVTFNDAIPGTAPRQQRRPFPQYQNITYTLADDNVSVHGLDLRLERRPGASGLTIQMAYSLLKALDTAGGRASVAGDPAFTSRNATRLSERGRGQGDIPGRFVLALGYELPFGPGKKYATSGFMGHIIGGWALQSILTLQSGPYLTVIVPFDRLDVGSTNSSRPDLIRNPNLPDSERTVQRWFDTSAFATPAAFTYGNAGRAIVEGPAISSLDLAIQRFFKTTETTQLEFRSEFFNSTNHPNFQLPGSGFGTPAFGVIAGALDGRTIQFGLRFRF